MHVAYQHDVKPSDFFRTIERFFSIRSMELACLQKIHNIMSGITADVIQVLNSNSLFIEYFITAIYMGPYKYFIRAVSTLCVLFIPFKSGIQIFTTQSLRAMRSSLNTTNSHNLERNSTRLFLFPRANSPSTRGIMGRQEATNI